MYVENHFVVERLAKSIRENALVGFECVGKRMYQRIRRQIAK